MGTGVSRNSAMLRVVRCHFRSGSSMSPQCVAERKGLVIGVHEVPEDRNHPGLLTTAAMRYDRLTEGRISEALKKTSPPPSIGEARVMYDLEPEYCSVAVVGLGRRCLGYDSFEQMDEGKEAIRIAIASGCRELQKLAIKKIDVDACGHAESAAEGAGLGVWLYQERRRVQPKLAIPHLEMYEIDDDNRECATDWTGWQVGLHKAAAQNLARQLVETPANVMTPTSFAQNAVEVLCKSGINVEVKVRGWAETHKMFGFLAAGGGSCEPPIFLELSYYGSSRDERPVVLIGKGVTYNSGGLLLASADEQRVARADMAGAACVVAATRAVAGLRLPINVRGLVPLCENMPGCGAARPGDVVRAMNGKTIELGRMDAPGRLVTADALTYAQSFWPRFIIDIGTNGNDVRHTTGAACCAVYTNSDPLFEYLLAAGMHTGDRVWRFPLWDHFTHQVTRTREQSADVTTHGPSTSDPARGQGFGCNCAAFLNEFVPCGDWLHIDAQGVLKTSGYDYPYYRQGMTGRPTRTIVEFLSQLVCHRN